jgi:hypothetical protein
VDARQALDDLMEISSQVDAAVLLRPDGTVEESTIADESRAQAVAAAARRLVDAAADVESGRALAHVELVTSQGCVFLVRDGERGRAAVGVTGPSATVGLVLYDLRTCLRNVGAGEDHVTEAASGSVSDGAAREE